MPAFFKEKMKTQGFSLVEVIFYVFLLSVILASLSSTIILLLRSYEDLKVSRRMQGSASISMDRLIKEIRQAEDFDISESVFGANPGRLLLTGTLSDGSPYSVDFYVEGGMLKIKENGVYSGNLTSSSTAVNNLIFRNIATGASKAIKVEMSLSENWRGISRESKYYSTAIMRNSY